MKRAIAQFLLKLAAWLGSPTCAKSDFVLLNNLISEQKIGIKELNSALNDARLVIQKQNAELRVFPESVLNASGWNHENAELFARFLASENGKALSSRLRLVAATVAINGAQDRANTIHAAGVSAGWNECMRYLFSLSRVSGDQGTKPNTEEQLQDEAALLEQLSP